MALGHIIASFHHLSHVALLVLIVTSSLALRDHGSSSLASHGSHHLSGRCESHFASGCQSTGIQSHIACPGILLCFTLRYPLPHPTPPCTPATHVLASHMSQSRVVGQHLRCKHIHYTAHRLHIAIMYPAMCPPPLPSPCIIPCPLTSPYTTSPHSLPSLPSLTLA